MVSKPNPGSTQGRAQVMDWEDQPGIFFLKK